MNVNIDTKSTAEDYCINLTTERVYRLDMPSALHDSFAHNRALAVQVEVRIPAEPQDFKEWLDGKVAKMSKRLPRLAECEDLSDYLDRFSKE